MPLNSLSAPSEGGIATKGRSSKEGGVFISYLEYSLGVQFQREVNHGRYVVDAFIREVPHRLDFPKLHDIPIGASLAIEYNGRIE